ncbi:MAG TPA: YbaN family protein [Thermohalobaculum sp.]|nr:YbaN family protein [Thermohalobaculum sp.]
MRLIWITAGGAALGLGLLGIALPLLPTVPFLLLAAFCFARGSMRFHDWLVDHPRLGPPIRAWREEGAISPRAKRAALVAMAASLVLSLALGVGPALLALQAAVLACVATFIVTRPAGRPR